MGDHTFGDPRTSEEQLAANRRNLSSLDKAFPEISFFGPFQPTTRAELKLHMCWFLREVEAVMKAIVYVGHGCDNGDWSLDPGAAEVFSLDDLHECCQAAPKEARGPHFLDVYLFSCNGHAWPDNTEAKVAHAMKTRERGLDASLRYYSADFHVFTQNRYDQYDDGQAAMLMRQDPLQVRKQSSFGGSNGHVNLFNWVKPRPPSQLDAPRHGRLEA
jgi:hypothetical protein